MLRSVAAHFAHLPILVVTDSWFGNNGLFSGSLERIRIHVQSSVPASFQYRAVRSAFQNHAWSAGRPCKYGKRLGSASELAKDYRNPAKTCPVFLYGKQREVLAYDQVIMLKNLRCPARVVWVFRKTRWVAFFTTDLTLSVQQIIEYYGARWKIEAGFKEIKQEIGSARSQTRNAHACQPNSKMSPFFLILLCHIMSCVRGAMWLSLTHCFIKVFYDDLAKFPLPPWKRPFSGSQITSTLILSHFRNFCHLAPAASVAHSTAISVDYSRHLVGACYA